eukprot:1765640-Amphidinium_carterae.1
MIRRQKPPRLWSKAFENNRTAENCTVGEEMEATHGGNPEKRSGQPQFFIWAFNHFGGAWG